MIAMNAAFEDVLYKKEPIRRNKKHDMRYAAEKFPIANYLTRWMDGGGASNSSTKSMLSPQSSKGAPPSEIETSTLMRSRPGLLFLAGIVPAFVAPRAPPSFLEPIEGGLGPGRGEWPSGQKRQTVNLLKFFYVVVGLPTRTRPPECLLGSGRSQADTYDRRRKDPHLIAPGERKFDRGLERRGGRKGSGWI
ncbi:hypothetical protein V6N12_076077 [Hibiscus sabdariffa]|uniref:Uncharacterized protein n=1 Tax=Hibiscus sabdariffa TaxID=183260 RepID=A0ABR2AY77_9ROSI